MPKSGIKSCSSALPKSLAPALRLRSPAFMHENHQQK